MLAVRLVKSIGLLIFFKRQDTASNAEENTRPKFLARLLVTSTIMDFWKSNRNIDHRPLMRKSKKEFEYWRKKKSLAAIIIDPSRDPATPTSIEA